jgi:ATPase family protein associated with various cellular activities (AAA)/AAA+ lid domain-containing protein
VPSDSKTQPSGPPRRGTGAAPGISPVTPATDRSAKQNEIQLLINSHTPIITAETPEEERLEKMLVAVAVQMNVPLFTWSLTAGLKRYPGAAIYGTDDADKALANIALISGDGIFLLKDFARYCENDRISRRLRDLADAFRTSRRSIVIAGASVALPPELECDAAAFELGLPSADELLSGVRQTLGEAQVPVTLDADQISQLAHNLVGLTQDEAARTLRKCLLSRGKADGDLLGAVLEAKHAALRTDGLLEVIHRDTSFEDVAGLAHLREWVEKRRDALTPEGSRFGLVPPKGILIMGVQGCGKSLAARAVAGEWGYELARLDAGALYDKYVGESEKHLHKTLELAQKLAPLVLWIDEIEKAFASAGTSGDADAGLSQRLLATLLTWMQDREGGVFLAATSNNLEILPPEMLRKGRFDEIFFVDLPNAEVRKTLFALYLRKRAQVEAGIDVAKLAAASEGFSGAEIEQAVDAAMYTAFDRKTPLSTEVLLDEIRGTRPLSVTRAEEVESIREWAKSRAAPAG